MSPFRRMAPVLAWLGGALFVASLLYFLYAYFIRFAMLAPVDRPAVALAIDFVLFTAFATHHSLLARSGVRRWVARHVSGRAERSLYVWIASLLFIAVCALWRAVPGTLYDHDGALGAVHWAVVAAGGLLTLRAARVLDPLELAGIRQVRGDVAPPRFRVSGPYRYVRHPIYLGWLLLVFGVPEMNGTRLAFAAISSAYLVIAVPFEERTLIEVFGEDYRRYQKAVRWRMVPFIW